MPVIRVVSLHREANEEGLLRRSVLIPSNQFYHYHDTKGPFRKIAWNIPWRDSKGTIHKQCFRETRMNFLKMESKYILSCLFKTEVDFSTDLACVSNGRAHEIRKIPLKNARSAYVGRVDTLIYQN